MVELMAWRIQDQQGWRKGPWTPHEDKLLTEYVNMHGEGRWSSVARDSGLNRTGKSCRLRWVNYLRPGLKRGQLTPQEEGIVIELHGLWGNKWSTIARYLPGRTDNEIKNYWRTHFKKKQAKSSKKQEKRKSQILKQMLLKQDNHDYDHDQQQLQPKEETMMKGLASIHVEAGTDQVKTITTDHQLQAKDDHQQRQENIMVSKLQNSDGTEDYFPMMHQDVACWWDSMADFLEYGSWGGLWNLDDHHPAHDDHGATMDHGMNQYCSKLGGQNNQALASYCGGDSNKQRAIENHQANHNNLYNYQGFSF
ncbi:hypothetical protein FEM48_Zijuj04G0058600 [Ziziphus jujuba var. spinosa]|uniref:Uncharacterized protein n=1 Tax=Ziziphus jujuba var. spinosa TaxID=714518 RepID=A0A978VI63_ZIZJJ|nr:hypothetical protein FEM48_Zijuj04G0058600 [Ziziphus jujuba var. spinosa]